MMRSPLIALSALMLGLSACASVPTVYGPAISDGYGYSERQIESDRFRIRFDAGPDMSIREAEDMALLRAAELTLENGGDWFVVSARGREGNDRQRIRPAGSFGVTTGSGGSGSSIGLGLIIDGSAGEKTASLESLVRTGERTPGPDNYDAREIIRNNPDCGCDLSQYD